MKDINTFLQEFFDILRCYPRIPGHFVKIEKSQMPQPYSVYDMRTYIDSSFKSVLQQYEYCYVQNHSDADNICLLDLKHYKREYNNCIEELAFTYNSESDTIEEIVVNSTPIIEK